MLSSAKSERLEHPPRRCTQESSFVLGVASDIFPVRLGHQRTLAYGIIVVSFFDAIFFAY